MSKKVLIACPACGRNVSLEARACPKCGQPMKEIKDAYVKKAHEDAIHAERKRHSFFKILAILFIIGVIGAVIKDFTTSPFSFTHDQFASKFFEKVEQKNAIRDEKIKIVEDATGRYAFEGTARTTLAITPSPEKGKKGTEKVKEITLQYAPVDIPSSLYTPSSFLAALESVTAVFFDFNLLSEKQSADVIMNVQKILALSPDARKKLQSQKVIASMTDSAGKTKDVLTIEIDPFGSYLTLIFTRP